MKKTQFTKLLSLTLCIVLIAAMALFATGCNDKSTASDANSVASSVETLKVGKGATVFGFTVIDVNGKETKFEVYTDKTTVGDALVDAELIAGDEGDYGLYVKTVNGTTLDYDKDGKYWAFYIDGEYAMTGVDSTEITADTEYTFKAE